MKGVVADLRHTPVCGYSRRHIGCLEGKFYGIKTEVLEQTNLPQGAIYHSPWDVPSKFLLEVGFKASCIDTDSYWHVGGKGCLHDFLYFPRLADVTGIQAQSVDSRLQGFQGQPVVKVDVSNHRQTTIGDDVRQRRSSLLVGDRHSDNLATLSRKLANLSKGSLYVLGVGLRHRLHNDLRSTPYGHSPNLYLPALCTHNFLSLLTQSSTSNYTVNVVQ